MKSSVIIFPGSNCDRDMDVALKKFGFKNKMIWHNDSELPTSDLVVLPGGFSYGDRLRAGVIAANSPVIKDVKKLADKGIPILGVCNGFQILVESNLLPGVLLKNNSLNFMCKWVNLIVKNNKTPFTSKLELNQKIPIPIANGEGRYYVNKKLMNVLKKNKQIVFTYENYVNGSVEQIAGVCNDDGNVVGMMPHPERATERQINPFDNRPSSLIFESLIDAIGVKN